VEKKGRYPVVTLCGSTKFKEEFIRVAEQLTLQGAVVISVGLFGHADNKFGTVISPGVKEMLDDLHLQKIDMAEQIFVINVGGYIGESTRNEIEYAKKQGKVIKYLENEQ
jgi:hypothetical protein